jgi:TonB family protein
MFRLVVVVALGAISLLAAEIAGKWTGTMEMSSNRVPVYLTLNQQDSKLVGSVATGNDAKQVPIENAELDADKLVFEVHDNVGRLVKFRLTLTGAALTGESTVDGQNSKVSLSRPGVVSVDGRVVSGSGDRAPAGSGVGQGFGPGVYRVGGGVSAPVLIHKTEPEYTEEARAAKYQGTVLLYVEVDPNGNATNIKVQRGLGLGLDEKAIEAVKKWKFKPGQKDGNPITVAATIELNFRL